MRKASIFSLFLLLFLFNLEAVAEESLMPFTVNAVQSEKQVDKSKSYFDVKIPSGQEEELIIQAHNSSKERVDLEVKVVTAKTNTNGVVEYGMYEGENSSKLPFKVEDIIDYPKEIQIDPNKTEEIKLLVKMPETEYEGIVVGGITIQEKNKTAKKTGQAMAIDNAYSYQIATVLHGKAEDPTRDLVFKNIRVDQKNYRNAIFLQLENPQHNYISNASFSAAVTKAGKQIPIDNPKVESIQIAPSSILDFPLFIEGGQLESGQYEVELTVKSDDETWKFNQSIDVSKSEVSRLNKSDIQNNPDFPYLLISIIVILLLAILAVTILVKKKKV